MLLRHLYDLAQSRKLLDDLAFAPRAVRWIIPLDSEGNMLTVGPQETTGERNRGKEFKCPQIIGDTNSGKVADFLAEGIDGMFGLSPNPKKPKDAAKLLAKNSNFWEQIRQCFEETQEPSVESLLKFRENLSEHGPTFLKYQDDTWFVISAQGTEQRLGNDEFTFSVDGKLLLENEKAVNYWRDCFARTQASEEAEELEQKQGVCLVTGELAQIARTHNPKIKRVPDTQGSGAKIVSFEKSSPSFSSYGLTQSYNAPVSEKAATAYCVALKWLLEQATHSVRIGPAVVCFWARESEAETDFLAHMLDRPEPDNVRAFLRAPWAGVNRELLQRDKFFSVTLAGNTGRIIVRHWMQMTLDAVHENLHRWFEDLEIVSYGDPAAREKRKNRKTEESNSAKEIPQPLALKSLAYTTVPDVKDKDKKIQTELLSSLYRAALEGTAPAPLIAKKILDRLKADLAHKGLRGLWPSDLLSRFALLRLVINRNEKEKSRMVKPQVFETDDPAYNCGRLLAKLEEAQDKAHEYKLQGAGITERFFGTACTMPARVFPYLLQLNRHHLRKIARSEKYKGHERFLEEEIAAICTLFGQAGDKKAPEFPRQLDPQAQGRFALGFYQQKAADRAARQAAQAAKKKGSDELSTEAIETLPVSQIPEGELNHE